MRFLRKFSLKFLCAYRFAFGLLLLKTADPHNGVVKCINLLFQLQTVIELRENLLLLNLLHDILNRKLVSR